MAGKIKIACKKCGRLCNISQIKKHEASCSGVYFEKKKTVLQDFVNFARKSAKMATFKEIMKDFAH